VSRLVGSEMCIRDSINTISNTRKVTENGKSFESIPSELFRPPSTEEERRENVAADMSSTKPAKTASVADEIQAILNL
jgi:hypothetical protein